MNCCLALLNTESTEAKNQEAGRQRLVGKGGKSQGRELEGGRGDEKINGKEWSWMVMIIKDRERN